MLFFFLRSYILTSSPHSVTVTTFPDMSIILTVLLDTSLLDLVVRRVTSSTVLHTPITSAMENRKRCNPRADFTFLPKNQLETHKVKLQISLSCTHMHAHVAFYTCEEIKGHVVCSRAVLYWKKHDRSR